MNDNVYIAMDNSNVTWIHRMIFDDYDKALAYITTQFRTWLYNANTHMPEEEFPTWFIIGPINLETIPTVRVELLSSVNTYVADSLWDARLDQKGKSNE